ncbi:hypothetical protein GOODEAATRI_029597 [Goodea atripinnis]|uniref:Uncharacterized protein n=1 Tax=Goodea atripinnis TaxID=208336 RepID=A0ABV0PSR2_9TELE
MTRGKYSRKSQKPELEDRGVDGNETLAPELTDSANESVTSTAEAHSGLDMAHLETILKELRDFRQENSDTLKEIIEEIRVASNRIDNAEKRIEEAEERLQHIEDATIELLELQKQFKTRLVDQEGRSRRGNIRIHGLKEGVEDGAGL